MFIYNK
ncbi:unnamed protein product [Larinioides sclopetarius]